jgi:cytochrome c
LNPIKLRALTVALLAVTSVPALSQSQSAPMPVPEEASIPKGPMGDAIKRGKELLTDTHKHLPRNVGNGLNCSSCLCIALGRAHRSLSGIPVPQRQNHLASGTHQRLLPALDERQTTAL